ncbi:MAG: hypothetical protein EOO38_23270 [Cytophagaceae bacterium]|nr:MAG: hypothetical protein EOO38_23270 [Cytophagaceae bacterium]
MPLPLNPPSPTRSSAERRFVRHIGLHHFAYLRAVAEGLDIAESAARYLGTEHGHEARSAHQQTDVTHEAPLREGAHRGGRIRWKRHVLTLRFAPEIIRIILGHEGTIGQIALGANHGSEWSADVSTHAPEGDTTDKRSGPNPSPS